MTYLLQDRCVTFFEAGEASLILEMQINSGGIGN